MVSIEPIEVEVAIEEVFEVVEEIVEHSNLEDPLQILIKGPLNSMQNMILTKLTTNSKKFWKNCKKVPWTQKIEMEQMLQKFQMKVMMNLLKTLPNPPPRLCLKPSMTRKSPFLTVFHLWEMKT